MSFVTDASGHHDDAVVQKIDRLLREAVAKGASDIHLEPSAHYLRVRLRIDGRLQDYQEIALQEMAQVLSRIKVMAHINIAEKRIPQDGKFNFSLPDGRIIDFRVATYPTAFGEKIVIRILDRTAHMVALENLGFSVSMLKEFKELVQRPQGFILVTGPTGSGKTTTLYSVLSLLNDPEKNILTIEDPIEYHLDGVTQGQINEAAGFSFESGMRALLRQDPDILMVGEIRDKKSAQIALEASLTGHMVLSTLHTNDAPSAFMRLIDMGIEPFLINASLTAVLAQRLVRTVCDQCRQQQLLDDHEKHHAQRFGLADDELSYKGAGCSQCDQRGYKGRTGVFELLKATPALRERVGNQPRYQDIYDQAVKDGMQALMADGIAKVKEGKIRIADLVWAVS